MNWQTADSVMFALEQCFQGVQQRMADLPILNPKLRVQAVDFVLFQGNWLGVLISPWFMNLLYLRPDALPLGTVVSHEFPAGCFDFVVGYEPELGFYQSCSLYSPMFAFEEQSVAVHTAQSALQALLASPELSRRDVLRGHFSKRNA